LLQNKSNKHVLEDLPTRTARVRGFLALFRPGLVYDIVSIADVAGPTGWDPDIQALVVSRETVAGASASECSRPSLPVNASIRQSTVDKIRREKALPPLQSFVIDVISSESANLEGDSAEALKQAKMSSTYIREWIVKNQTRETPSDPDNT
jgi:pantetheine-phosphate adenylyltransferase